MQGTTEPTTPIEKRDRCGDLPHRPRVLLGKMGLDGHDRGVKLIARLMRDSGIHVIYSGLWQTPRSLAIGARDEDADCIACSMMSNSHLVLVPRLIEECRALGRADMVVNVGGIIPQEDVQPLLDAGVNRVYHTGTGLDAIVDSVREAVKGYAALQSPSAEAKLARRISMAHAKPTGKLQGRRPKRVIGITGAPPAKIINNTATPFPGFLSQPSSNHPGGVVAVAHAGPIRALLCDALGLPLARAFRLEVAHARPSVVEWVGGHPVLRSLNGPPTIAP